MDRLNENITLDNLYLFRFRVCAKLPIQKDLPNKNNFMDNNFLQKKSLIFHNRIFHKTIIVLIFIRGQSLLINANDPNGQLAPSKPLSRLIHSSSRPLKTAGNAAKSRHRLRSSSFLKNHQTYKQPESPETPPETSPPTSKFFSSFFQFALSKVQFFFF